MMPGIKGVDQNRSKSFSSHRSASQHHFIMESLPRFEGLFGERCQFYDRIFNLLGRSVNADVELAKIIVEMKERIRDRHSSIILCQETVARQINVGTFESRTATVDSAETDASQVDSFNLLRRTLKTELRCTICTDLMVSATILNCKHCFCNVCITQWENRTKSCPVCRTHIVSKVQSHTIDNIIEMLKSLPKMSNNSATEPIQHLVVVAGPGVAETDDSRPQAVVAFPTPSTPIDRPISVEPPQGRLIRLSPISLIDNPFRTPVQQQNRPTAVLPQLRRMIRPRPVTPRGPTGVLQRRPIRPNSRRRSSSVRQQQQRRPAQPIRRPAWRI